MPTEPINSFDYIPAIWHAPWIAFVASAVLLLWRGKSSKKRFYATGAFALASAIAVVSSAWGATFYYDRLPAPDNEVSATAASSECAKNRLAHEVDGGSVLSRGLLRGVEALCAEWIERQGEKERYHQLLSQTGTPTTPKE